MNPEDTFDNELFASQPNDAFFKGVFSDPARAAELLQEYLPKEVAAVFDWPTLRLLPSSYVKQDLQQAHSDLLFEASCSGHSVLVYLLLEHQTTVDPKLPLRLLSYMTQVLMRHADEQGLPLPPVLPFVLHQGPERWTVSTQFADMFDCPATLRAVLAPYLPSFEHGLLDLSQVDPSGEDGAAQLRVVLELMKAAREKRLMEFFDWLSGPGTKAALVLENDVLKLCFVYAWNNDPDLDVERLSRHLLHEPRLHEAMITTAQRLRNEGRNEGVWIGKLQFLQEMMNLPVTPKAEFKGLSEEQLQAAFTELETTYRAQFKPKA